MNEKKQKDELRKKEKTKKTIITEVILVVLCLLCFFVVRIGDSVLNESDGCISKGGSVLATPQATDGISSITSEYYEENIESDHNRNSENADEGYIQGSAFTLHIKGQSISVARGIDSSVIDRGPGWMMTSSYPGKEGMCVVFGHRNRNHFLILKDVQVGDHFTLTLPTRNEDGTRKTIEYVVEKTKVVESDAALRIPISRQSKIMLVTCYPFYYSGHAPKKWVVISKVVIKHTNSIKPITYSQ